MASEIKVNTIKKASGSTITNSGTATGFKDIDWQSVVVADGSTNTTAEAGKGYFINTTSATHTINLPSSPSLGDTIIIVDYASTFATNNVTLNPNGNKIEASTSSGILSNNDQTHTIVYTDSTQGWKIVNQDTATSIQPTFTQATGGTVTTSGDFKIHKFTSSGSFCVSAAGNSPSMPGNPAAGPNAVSYFVLAGGGSGGADNSYSGGGGAGGLREGETPTAPYTGSPLKNSSGLTISSQTYPVTVGGGGSTSNGSDSVFSTITSAGGGRGRYGNCAPQVGSGGSGGGGGGGGPGAAGSGNTPPVSPPQGSNGGGGPTSAPRYGRAGGGGAVDAGSAGSPSSGGEGGAATTSEISGASTSYAAGGGGGYYSLDGCSPGAAGNGGSGGSLGGAASATKNTNAGSGNANTGTGGGGATAGGPSGSASAGNGGSGVVIIRYKYQ